MGEGGHLAWRPRAPIAAGLVLAAVALGACGDGTEDESPAPAELRPGSVAAVGGDAISRGQLARQVSRVGGEASNVERAEVERQALRTLLQRAWVEQLAEEQGVEVSPAEAQRRWRRVARRQFPSARARRRFLRGQSEAEIVTQLRTQALAERATARVREEEGEQAAERFARRLADGWRESSICRPRYASAGCDAR